TDQCLPPGTMIATPEGTRPIESIEIGDRVLGACQRAAAVAARVVHVHEGRFEGEIVQVRCGDVAVSATPGHLVPMRLVPQDGSWLAHLMFCARPRVALAPP